MSMSLALEFTQEWLREKYGWDFTHCGVQQDALPANNAGSFYIAIDDGGVEPGNETTDSLRESLSLTIGIWRRPEHLQPDKRGFLKLPTDKYLLGSWTLHSLERSVIIHKSVGGATFENRNGLHNNFVFLNAFNQRYNLPDPEYGAKFQFPLRYRGRGRMEVTSTETGPGPQDFQQWYGYRLRFRGLEREQKYRTAEDAIG